MALVLNDRVKETSTTTGTGTLNLAGAVTGFETFVAGIGNSNTTYYAITLPATAEFEVGLGTITDASPDTLARTTVISSSNSDNAVNFSAGTKTIFCTMPASKTVFLDASGNTTLGADLSVGDDLTVLGGIIDLKSNSGSVAALRMYCESSNAHFQTLSPQPHSADASNTLRLPDSGDGGTQDLVAVGITQTLTNKTLTAPTMTGTSTMVDLDISGTVDVDGTTNLDIVDIDGAVNIAAATTIATNNKIIFRDAAIHISSTADGDLSIAADDEIDLTSTLIDINGNVEISGTATTTGVHTFTAVPVFPNNTVETADIQADAITSAKIADDAIDSEHYTDGSIDTAHISADAITEAKIADNAVESEHINDNVISGQTELASGIADADELLISDAGTIKRVDASVFKTYIGAADDATALAIALG